MKRKRILEPIDRISEILFALIMVLTFTGSLSVAEAGRADAVRAMLIAALGCNLAWGIVDGVMFLMGCLADQGGDRRLVQAVRSAPSPDAARRFVADALPPIVASLVRPAELESLRERLAAAPEPAGVRLGREEWLGALAVFLLVFLSTFPVVIPFLLIHDVFPAMRVSNAVALAMLYLAGHVFGRVIGHRPWLTGLAMVGIGAVLVAVTIALGG
jgi:hypothetical protein